MNRFIKNIAFFFVIAYVINVFTSAVVNPYFGNRYYDAKYRYFKEHRDEYNTVIFGSSRSYRQINPEIFDKLLQENGFKTFNLASPSTFNPEIYQLYDDFLNDTPKGNCKCAIIELLPLNIIDERNIKTAKNNYWIDIAHLLFALRYNFARKISWERKIDRSLSYLASYFYKLMDTSKFETLLLRNDNDEENLIGKRKDGYYSLEKQMEDIGGDNPLKKRRKLFLKNTKALDIRIERSKAEMNKYQREKNVNRVHLEKLLSIIDRSEKKGIHVIYFIPPRLVNYAELLPLKYCLPQDRLIDVTNALKYPNLYRVEYSFDIGHLNDKGADFLTEAVAEKVKKIFDHMESNKT